MINLYYFLIVILKIFFEVKGKFVDFFNRELIWNFNVNFLFFSFIFVFEVWVDLMFLKLLGWIVIIFKSLLLWSVKNIFLKLFEYFLIVL